MAANHILVTSYKKDNLNNFSASNTEVVGFPVQGATFNELASDDPAAVVGCNSKIVYKDSTGVLKELFVADTTAELVAQSNGTVLAS